MSWVEILGVICLLVITYPIAVKRRKKGVSTTDTAIFCLLVAVMGLRSDIIVYRMYAMYLLVIVIKIHILPELKRFIKLEKNIRYITSNFGIERENSKVLISEYENYVYEEYKKCMELKSKKERKKGLQSIAPIYEYIEKRLNTENVLR